MYSVFFLSFLKQIEIDDSWEFTEMYWSLISDYLLVSMKHQDQFQYLL